MNARTFALIFGIVFLAVGILGFGIVPGVLTDQQGSGMQVSGMLLGKFHVNALHNIIHILFGLWGLLASRSWRGALVYARSIAIIYFLLAIAGLLPATQTGFGLLPLYAKDVWLHGLIALGGLYFGWAARGADRL